MGPFSRKGKSRTRTPVKAIDHDMNIDLKLVPGGILETMSRKAFIFFTDNFKTCDFMVDGIIAWWESVRSIYSTINRIVINLDNGPECNGRRTRFLQRMVEFVDKYGIEVRLVYYPVNGGHNFLNRGGMKIPN